MSALASFASANIEDNAWANYDIFKINKEDPSAMMKVFGNSTDAKKPVSIDEIDNIHVGDRYKLLNGDWQFFFANSRKDVKKEFFEKDFDDSKWDKIKVPNSWQCAGYDNIFYDNITMQFMFDEKGVMHPDFVNDPSRFKRHEYAKAAFKPYIPEKHQQAGIYRRTFEVPADWNGQNVFIRFDGVRTGFKLVVNGKFVGYSEDSFTPAEFDITKFIERGKKNSLAVEVYKYSTGSYNEMQDMPHVMGIIRDVFLLARPNVYIKDYHAPATLNDDLDSAEIDFTVKLRNISDKEQKNINVEALLIDNDGKVFAKSFWKNALLDEDVEAIPAKSYFEINKKIDVSGFKLWSPDKPNFYNLVIKLTQDGKELETIRADFGFRKYKIVDRHMELNNVKMLIKGVNRHDWSPETGKAVSFKEMKRDVELMCECNINFVRTAHYPNDDRFYMLCTRYGIAMLDENNHEQHTFIRNSALHLPNHTPPAVDRAKNMIFRDRNIPAILIVSMGNESALMFTNGHRAIEKVFRENSPQHYFFSHGETYDIVNGAPNGTSDFVSPMYRDITQMERYLEMDTKKPFFFPEYAHGMGNSIGNLEGMWKMIRKTEGLNGGFIWDWVDQSLYLPCENNKSKKYLSDGRDWKTIPTQQNFCCNGIIFADRTVSAKFFEVKKVYQHIYIDQYGKCPLKLKITNEMISTNLDEFTPIVYVERDGKMIAKKTLDEISLAPGETKEIEVELPEIDSSKIGEYFYTLSFIRKNPIVYEKAGDVAATAQMFLKKVEGKQYATAKGEINVKNTPLSIEIKAGDTEIVFDKSEATLKSYKIGNTDVIISPVEFDLKSAYIDNHRRAIKGQFENNRLHLLKKSSTKCTLEKLPDAKNAVAVRVNCETIYDNGRKQGFKTNIAYTILADGTMQVSAQAIKINKTPKYILIPRVGLRMGVNKNLDSVKYLGKGPMANYIDRASAANVGVYESKVADWFEPFTYTQDTGNREQVRWLSLTNGKSGVLISAETPLPMAVLPHTQNELLAAPHPYQLPKSKATDLRIAAKVLGLGNASCGLIPRDDFRLDFKGSLEWKFVIRPLAKIDDAEQMGRELFPAKFDVSPKHYDKNVKAEGLRTKVDTNKPATKKSNIGDGSLY